MIITTIYDNAGYTFTSETNQGIYDILLINVSKNLFKDSYKKLKELTINMTESDFLYMFKLEYKKKIKHFHCDIVSKLKKGIETNRRYNFKDFLTKLYNESNFNETDNWVFELINS